MHDHGSYHTDLVVASLLRVGLVCGLLAIMAMMSACTVPTFPSAKEILPKFSADADISQREGNQTRNYNPNNGGCNEKSDSSLRGPLT